MKWILIKESLPEQGVDVLLFDGGQIYFGYYSEISAKFIVAEDKVEIHDFTHWTELPKFPGKQEILELKSQNSLRFRDL